MIPSVKPRERIYSQCPGCNLFDGLHLPLCQVAVRLTAARAVIDFPGRWREVLLLSSAYFAGLYRCRWHPIARHLRQASCDTPEPDEVGEALTWVPSEFILKPDEE